MSPRLSIRKSHADTPVHPLAMDSQRLAQIRQASLHLMMGVAALLVGAHLLAILLLVWL